ncbi:MAG TPA: sigma-70 family RNA polymerase sigma factor [Planctomycetota bacterium]|nr:sigma-70 family RNA polymerase sigma factor [Planctomycetota bacterium]
MIATVESVPQATCWTLIRAAAAGQSEQREEFTRRYLPAVRAYFGARWRTSPLRSEMDDAVQEVFVACFREGGVLARARPEPGGFRAFLFGVIRNVALHLERTRARRDRKQEVGVADRDAPDEEPSASRAYDRAYARAVMQEAARVMAARAQVAGTAARRRVEILRLRFQEGLPIREIARLWQCDAIELHREHAKAAREFKSALRIVVGLSERCAPDRLEQECKRLLDLLAG